MTSWLPGFERVAPDVADEPDGAGDEWYTPPEVLRAVVAAAGPIDLDPCYARGSLVRARHTIDTRRGGDGRIDPWPGDGLVWINPPYSDVEPWLGRAAHAARSRPVVVLIPMRPETAAWWRHVWLDPAACVVIHRGRLRFVAADGSRPGGGKIATCFVTWDAALAHRLAAALGAEGIEAAAVRRQGVLL